MDHTTDAYDTIDWLVNNAGVAEFGPIRDCDFKAWRRVMETNLDGVFLVSQAFTEALIESCRVLPEDPIDFLAECLLQEA